MASLTPMLGTRQDYVRLSDGKLSDSAPGRDIRKLLPILDWLPAYHWRENFFKDLAAGLTLGSVLFAQSLAHAALCKVSLITGPYSCLAPPLLYAVFGTCVQASVGTGGLVSLLTGEQLAGFGDEEQRTHAGAIFTLLVGLMIGAMGVFQLAFLVRFLSKPALSGFITASALLIMLSQVKPALGIPKSDVGGIMTILLTHPKEMDDLNPATVVFSCGCFAFLQLMKSLKSLSRALKILSEFKEVLLLIISALLASRIAEPCGIAIIGSVPSGFPDLRWPLQTSDDFQLARELAPGAAMVALVTFLSSFAAAKKFALKAGYQVVAINELLGLGAANLAGALCGGVPTQIGLSRMGIASSIGVASQLGANVMVAAVVAFILLLLSPYIYFVPRCALNIIIILGASSLTEFNHAYWLWSLRSTKTRQRTYIMDFLVWWVAFLFTLILGALKGILGAVVVSLVLIVYQVADPPITRLGFCECRGRWLSVKEREDTAQRPGILAVRPEGPLFYANMERLEEWLNEMEISANAAGTPVKAIVLSAAAVGFVDTSALEALVVLMDAYQKRHIALLVAHASGQPRQILNHTLGDVLPAGSLTTPWTVEECVQYLLAQQKAEFEQAALLETHVKLQAGDPSAPLSPLVMRGSQTQVRVPSMQSFPVDSDRESEGMPSPRSDSGWHIRPLQSSVQFASGADLASQK